MLSVTKSLLRLAREIVISISIGIICWGAVVIIVIAVLSFTSDNENVSTVNTTAVTEDITPRCAKIVVSMKMMEVVSSYLYNPRSLDDWDINIRESGKCEYRVDGTFTATNGFGGRVQGAFVADVEAEFVGRKRIYFNVINIHVSG
jgi:hypothetical protein